MDSYIRHTAFREPKPNDPAIDFATYHDTVMSVARMLGIGLNTEPNIPVLRFMELDDDLPPYDETAEADDETGNMPYIDKSATVLYYDPADQLWKRDDTQQKVVVCNPYAGFYPKAGRFLFLWLSQSAKWIPFSTPPRVGGKLLANLDTRDGDASAEATVWRPGSAFEVTDPTVTMKVYPSFASTLGMILEGMKIEAEWDGECYRVVKGGKARWINFEIGDGGETDCHVLKAIEGEDPDPDDEGLTVLFDARFTIVTENTGKAIYIPEDDVYDCVQLDCS